MTTYVLFAVDIDEVFEIDVYFEITTDEENPSKLADMFTDAIFKGGARYRNNAIHRVLRGRFEMFGSDKYREPFRMVIDAAIRTGSITELLSFSIHNRCHTSFIIDHGNVWETMKRNWCFARTLVGLHYPLEEERRPAPPRLDN